MKRKRIIQVLLAFIALCQLMSGCADGDNLEYLSVSEAVGTAKEVLGTQYENLVLPEKMDIESVNELYTVKADYKKNCDKEKLADELAKLMDPDLRMISSAPNGEDSIKNLYKSDSVNATVWYYDDSTFAYARDEHSGSDTLDLKSKYYLVGKDDLNASYTLNSESWTVAEAVRYAESFANEKLIHFLPNDTCLEAEAVKAAEMNNGNWWLLVQLTHYMYGCPVSTSGDAIEEEAYMRPQRLIITFDGKEDICHIENDYYANITEKTALEKIVSLGSALKHLEKTLASEKRYTISCISLEYCTRIEDISSPEFEYRPMWCLTVEEGQTSKQLKPIRPRKVIYIDAVSGDVCCFSDEEMRMVF